MITLCRKTQEYKLYDNGKVRRIYYMNKYGNYHNLYGPAYILYYENGNKYIEEYYINVIPYYHKELLENAKNHDNTL